MNKKLVQSYLDRAAEELDEAGFRDLADKVDAFNAQLMATDSPAKHQSIAAELTKIDREASRRTGEVEKPEEDTRATRLAALRRRMAIRRRLKAKMAERAEKSHGNLARAQRMARLARARRESIDKDSADDSAERREIALRLARRHLTE